MAMESAEQLLWERYCLDRDQEARDYLFLLYAPWATSIARSVFHKIRPAQMELADYVQNATVGLLEAMSRFDVARGIDFKLYGKPRVRGAVFNGLRVFLSESRPENSQYHYSDRLASLELERSDDPFEEVVDSVIGLSLGYMLDITSGHGHLSSATDGMAYTHSRQIENVLLLAVEALPDRLRMIVSAHYFQHVPFQELAVQLGVTKGRVSQLHKTALRHIREKLQDLGHADPIKLDLF